MPCRYCACRAIMNDKGGIPLKRTIALFLCLGLLLTAFAGCGGKTEETGTSETQEVVMTQADGEYTLAREINTNQLTFYWVADGVDYSKCDMWIWYQNVEPRGYAFHETKKGGKVMLNVPLDVTEVGFIVRKNCSDPGGTSWGEAIRDVDIDRYATITGSSTELWLKPQDSSQYYSTDGGKTLIQCKKLSLAAIDDLKQISYSLTTSACFTSLDQIKVLDGERELPIHGVSSLNKDSTSGVITLDEELDLTKAYTVALDGFDPQRAIPMKVFDTQAFLDRYFYNGDDLGATVRDGETTFKLWAPTASKVLLELFQVGNGGNAINRINMTQGEKGVWSATVKCGNGTYYLYHVTTAQGTQKAVDPYAKSVGVNGERGMVVESAATNPEGFDEDQFYTGIKSYNQAVIWDVHVRDFSNAISTSQYPGKYLAFTETGLTNNSGQSIGLDYLKNLGITHVQLQPIFDFASIDEDAVRDSKYTGAKFNWGFDAKNFNAPEGSYSTDPFHGEVRVKEVKQMVQALHSNGIGVVMDVSYNHTYDINSNLNKIVPYYYYRYTSSGAPSNGSGFGNETATDRPMFRKFIVESLCHWAREYHIDGFRFDMMSLYDVDTIQTAEKAIHAINPNAILYGESRTGGSTVLSAGQQANQSNIQKIEASGNAIGGVALMNDAFRDGLRGSSFDGRSQGYINGASDDSNSAKVIFGLAGGAKNNAVNWSVENNMVINYVSSHLSSTGWDKLQQSNSSASEAERYAMLRLGEEILMMSGGTPLMLAGEEMLRTKRGDSNSYKSSDAINNIDWNALTSSSLQIRMRNLVRKLIALRKVNSFFTDGTVECELLSANVIRLTWTVGRSVIAVGFINPNNNYVSAALPSGRWEVLFTGETSDSERIGGKDVLIFAAPGMGVQPPEEVELEPIEPEGTGTETTETTETAETTETTEAKP